MSFFIKLLLPFHILFLSFCLSVLTIRKRKVVHGASFWVYFCGMSTCSCLENWRTCLHLTLHIAKLLFPGIISVDAEYQLISMLRNVQSVRPTCSTAVGEDGITSQHMPPNTDYAHDKYLWTITSNFSHSTGYHSLMMDPLWSETCWSNF